MSMYITRFHIRELNLDENDNIIGEFDQNLPHHEFICKEMCKSWNEMHMEKFYDGILKDKLESVTMAYGVDNEGKSYGRIIFKGVPGFRFSEKRRNEMDEQTTAQFTDGWGERFFYPYNTLTTPDGTKVAVE